MKKSMSFVFRMTLLLMTTAGLFSQVHAQSWIKPDFSVTAIELIPSPTLAGESFDAKVTVRNNGSVASDAGVLRVWVSQAAWVAAGTPGDAEQAVGSLNVGESKVLTFSGLTAAATAGTHHFRAFVDADGTVEEYSDGDNQISVTYTFTAGWIESPVPTDSFGSGANAFHIDFVDVGNAGNPDDSGSTGIYHTVYGGVDYAFRMGKYEVSEDMINKANTLGGLGITKNPLGLNRPATIVSWNEAARFVNWLNTSKGYSPAYKFALQPGDAGYSANANLELWQPGDEGYDANNLYRNANAFYFLPSEDEWYKAAYYSGTGSTYFDFATQQDAPSSTPTAVSGGTGSTDVVYLQPHTANPADIDNTGGLSFYGTMGQSGNVFEWIESALDGVNDSESEYRVIRGGHWFSNLDYVSSVHRNSFFGPFSEHYTIGFRVASMRASDTGRVSDNLLALYTFNEKFGDIVYDQVGGMDLTLFSPSLTSWIPEGGLRFEGGFVSTPGPALSLVDALKVSNALTVEAWIRPENLTQSGPARIVTLSDGIYSRDFTLGQSTTAYGMRLRRSPGSNLNGEPEKLTPTHTVKTELQHVVYTRNAAGEESIYVDGVEVASGVRSGSFSGWGEYVFGLGNETSFDRAWMGDMFLVALYDRALTEEEVEQNFDAGVEGADQHCVPQTDDFTTGPGLQSFWRLHDPLLDAEISMSGTDVVFGVPAGSSHDLWSGSGNRAPRILQATDDGDFAIETGFKTLPSLKYQMQGLIVQETDNTFLRFGTYSDGSAIRTFVAFIDGGSATVLHSAVPLVSPNYLRVERRGDTWTYRYSDDGNDWYKAVVFDQMLLVTESGVYVGNHTPNPAYTTQVDYFKNICCPTPAHAALKKPDYAVTAVQLIPVPTATGMSFDAEVTIRNDGVLAGNAGILRAYVDHVNSALAGEAGDADLPAGELAVGESRTLTFTGLTAPATGGTFHFRAFIDAENTTDELSEGNNQHTAAYTLAGSGPASWEKPDFIVTSVVLTPEPTAPGESFNATVTIQNVGVLAGSAGELQMFAHAGAVPMSVATPNLNVGQSWTIIFAGLTAPATGGTFHAKALVDALNDVAELSDGNNHLSTTYTTGVAGGGGPAPVVNTWERPDFAVSSIAFVGDAPTTTGQPYTVRVTVTNNGQVAGDAGSVYLYPSMAGFASPGDVGSAAVAVPVGLLAVGGSATFDVQLTTPNTRGVHHTRAQVVSPETEWSTGDNQLTTTSWIKAVTLTVTPAGASVELQWNNYWGDTYTLYRKVDAGSFVVLTAGIASDRPQEFNIYIDTPPAGVVMYRVEID